MPQESSKRDLYVILLMGCECWWSICHANVTWTYQTYEYWYPYIPQETYTYQKRPKHAKRVVKRDLYMIVLMGLCCEWSWSICDMNISNIWILTPIHTKRDPYITKESSKKNLFLRLPMGCVVSVPEAFVTHTWHEHIKHMKIDTHTYQKRPIYTKRDPWIPKETHIYQERPIYTKWDSYIPKETQIYQKTHVYHKRPIHTKGVVKIRDWWIIVRRGVLWVILKHMWHEDIKHMNIDTHTYQKRPIHTKRDPYIPKETHSKQKSRQKEIYI